jgi:preprotein translocase subunit YajC
MIATHALVLAVVAAPAGGLQGFLAGPGQQFVLLGAIALMFYFMILRPQQRRAREHAARVESIKRGDTVVLSSGLIGKVVRVEDREVGLEIAQNVSVKVVKGMIAEVRARGEPAAANDAKS